MNRQAFFDHHDIAASQTEMAKVKSRFSLGGGIGNKGTRNDRQNMTSNAYQGDGNSYSGSYKNQIKSKAMRRITSAACVRSN